MYEFVSKKEVSFARDEIEKVIHKVQGYLRENNVLTFQYDLVGSARNHRHLVTRIKGCNQGFDLDYNIIIKQLNDDYNNAKAIKFILMKTFNMFLPKDYKYCEDSSSVFTLKKVDKKQNKIVYSFDFAIVDYFVEEVDNPDFDDYDDPQDESLLVERQVFICFDKNDNSYFWELRPIASDHRYMKQCVKSKSSIWNELRDLYLKHKNSEQDKKSREIYYAVLNQVYQKHFN